MVSTAIDAEPGTVVRFCFKGGTDDGVPCCHLQDAHGEGDGGLVLTSDMHQIAAQDTIRIHADVVVRLAFGRRSWYRRDSGRHVEDGHQGGFVSKAITQALLVGPDAFVQIDIKADGHDACGIERIEGFAEHTVINRPPEAFDVIFFNAHQGDGCVLPGTLSPLAGDQVVKHQIKGLGQACAAKQQKHHHGSQVRACKLHQPADALHTSR